MGDLKQVRITIEGIVQGVGFRPFVYRLANSMGIEGSVSNSTGGVEITSAADNGRLEEFVERLRTEAPSASVIEKMTVVKVGGAPPFEASGFGIVPSSSEGERKVLVSPDLATCDDCIEELFDPEDRRYRYPFTNCTNCGPRFTIIEDIPYDRPSTSMARFEMCERCRTEYEDPGDRRYHAQPNACPDCGPSLWLEDGEGLVLEGDPVVEAAGLLKDGGTVAVKGLGGFQLACDATSEQAVERLRLRKGRYSKPLAVMVTDPADAESRCEVGPDDSELLCSPRAPIVLLKEKEGSGIAGAVAPGLDRLGLFLPSTPVHHLLVREAGVPLVMTSGNVSDEPIVIDNDEARTRLNGIADALLLHDRDILVRYDDSVTSTVRGGEYPIRRARGYAPYPVAVDPPSTVEVLAVGPELKNTFCFLRGRHAFLSQHIGDMETASEVEHFEAALLSIGRLFALSPEAVAHDLHPDYTTTHLAAEMGLPSVGVQHHHAHIASCMAENGLTGEVIGVAWDGTGYGEDGTVWGGEFLVCDRKGYRRPAHLHPYRMPGADACIRKIYRMAVAVLMEVLGHEEAVRTVSRNCGVPEERLEVVLRQAERGVNTPVTSGAGRMFDVASALTGVRSTAVYDGQAACELEAVSRRVDADYPYILDTTGEPWVLDTRPTFEALLEDVSAGFSPDETGGKFHRTAANMIIDTCAALGSETGLERVVLSGGVFQNRLLLTMAIEGLKEEGLDPFLHRRVPCNDGGISLGQAVIAAERLGE